ncbi:MAG TPA: serine/threonine-protein kinase [Kofleriaceae bacterium]|nr:serine/threonine-protein kinase [Kofleriaceae bacterium]
MRDRAAGGNYEIVGHLATGGMAELFLARAPDRTGPYVVLKRILPEQARRSELVSMFLDEARLSSRLHHPNIARVLDVGRAGHSYFYTMEYVHGRNLREVLEHLVEVRRFFPLDATLSVLVAAAAGLHAAHEQRDRNGRSLEIVHRDVSPSNVMVGFDGGVKIVDFGVAHAIDHVSETRSGVVKGKTGYLAPEQCTMSQLDRRCDVFALGIVAYELVTRTRLFRRRSEYETMHAIVSEHPAPPSQVRRQLPPALDPIIMRALEKNRAHRYNTAADFQADLAALAHQLGIATGPIAVVDAMHSLFGDCPEPWHALEQVRQGDTAVVRVSAFERSFIDDEPTDPDADAIDLAMSALEPRTRATRPMRSASGDGADGADAAHADTDGEHDATDRTPAPFLPSGPPSPFALARDSRARDTDGDDARPTRRRVAASAPPPARQRAASEPPPPPPSPHPALAVGTLRPGARTPLAPLRPVGFPSVSLTTFTGAAPPPPVRPADAALVIAPAIAPAIASPVASDPFVRRPLPLPPPPPEAAAPEPRLHRRAAAILFGAALGGIAIALVIALATC